MKKSCVSSGSSPSAALQRLDLPAASLCYGVILSGFAENITTEGIDMAALKLGDKLRLGAEVEIKITQFGKKCHGRCEIYEQIGDCIMPREGVFAKVSHGGSIRVGDDIEVIDDGN